MRKDFREALREVRKWKPVRDIFPSAGQRIEVILHYFTAPILDCLAPDSDIEHLQHSLLNIGQGSEIHIIQTWQNVQQEGNPATRIDDSKTSKRNCIAAVSAPHGSSVSWNTAV